MPRILPVCGPACTGALSTDRPVGYPSGLVAVRLLGPRLGSPAARSVAPWGRIGVSQGYGGLPRRLVGGAGACALLVLGWRRRTETAGRAVPVPPPPPPPANRPPAPARPPLCSRRGGGDHPRPQPAGGGEGHERRRCESVR